MPSDEEVREAARSLARSLGHLDPDAFSLFLALLGEALSAHEPVLVGLSSPTRQRANQ